MDFTCLLFGAVFIVAGIMFACGKLHNHIKAWNSMTAEEKEDINIKPLCVNIGSMISICGVVFMLAGVFLFFRIHIFIWCMILWIIAAGIDVYFIGKNKKFRR